MTHSHETTPDRALRIAVLTTSNRVARGEAEDRGGERIAAVFTVTDRDVVPDDRDRIAERLRAFVADDVDVILTTGGTGLTLDDVTPEATRDVLERDAPGIAEALRLESLKYEPRAALSRGVAGTAGRTLIVNLPGNPKAVDELAPVLETLLPHAVALLRR